MCLKKNVFSETFSCQIGSKSIGKEKKKHKFLSKIYLNK